MRSKIIQLSGTAALMLAGMALAAVLTAAQAPSTPKAATPKATTPKAVAPKSAASPKAGSQTPAAAKAADQASAEGTTVRVTGTTENVAVAHDSVRIDLLRLSTDAERDQIGTAWTQALARAAALAASGGRAGRGGAAGAKVKVIFPGDSRQSLLAQKLNDLTGKQMPPKGPLGGADIAVVVGWIEQGAKPKAAAAGQIDYAKDVQPVFNTNCLGCHAGNTPKAGLRLDTLENVMIGGDDLDAEAAAKANAGDDPNGLREPVAAGPGRALTPEGSLMAALEKAPTLGYLWTSAISGYAVHYAVRVPQPDGGQKIILITDRRLGDQDDSWKPVGPAAASQPPPNDYEFSILELHLNAKGEGEGKASVAGKLTLDNTSKAIVLENYGALPVVLKGVTLKNLGKS